MTPQICPTHHTQVLPVEQLTESLSSVSLNDSLSPRQTAEVKHVLKQSQI